VLCCSQIHALGGVVFFSVGNDTIRCVPGSTESEVHMPKILVVDDDLAILATISLGLRRAGYQVLQVDSGVPAIRICRHEKPDLAILDMNLPDMSGLQVAEALRKETSTPFIFLSAHSGDDLVKAAVAAGALGYLVKPVEVARIVPAIEVALKRADELEQLRLGNANLGEASLLNRDTDMAVGLIMERHQLDRAAAFDLLRASARGHSGGIADLAKRLVDGEKVALTPD
jgi:two-component system, response regulator PdtaR